MSAGGDRLTLVATEHAMALVSARLGLQGDEAARAVRDDLLALELDELRVTLAALVGFAATLVVTLEENTESLTRERVMSTAAATYLYKLDAMRDR